MSTVTFSHIYDPLSMVRFPVELVKRILSEGLIIHCSTNKILTRNFMPAGREAATDYQTELE